MPGPLQGLLQPLRVHELTVVKFQGRPLPDLGVHPVLPGEHQRSMAAGLEALEQGLSVLELGRLFRQHRGWELRGVPNQKALAEPKGDQWDETGGLHGLRGLVHDDVVEAQPRAADRGGVCEGERREHDLGLPQDLPSVDENITATPLLCPALRQQVERVGPRLLRDLVLHPDPDDLGMERVSELVLEARLGDPHAHLVQCRIVWRAHEHPRRALPATLHGHDLVLGNPEAGLGRGFPWVHLRDPGRGLEPLLAPGLRPRRAPPAVVSRLIDPHRSKGPVVIEAVALAQHREEATQRGGLPRPRGALDEVEPATLHRPQQGLQLVLIVAARQACEEPVRDLLRGEGGGRGGQVENFLGEGRIPDREDGLVLPDQGGEGGDPADEPIPALALGLVLVAQVHHGDPTGAQLPPDLVVPGLVCLRPPIVAPRQHCQRQRPWVPIVVLLEVRQEVALLNGGVALQDRVFPRHQHDVPGQREGGVERRVLVPRSRAVVVRAQVVSHQIRPALHELVAFLGLHNFGLFDCALVQQIFPAVPTLDQGGPRLLQQQGLVTILERIDGRERRRDWHQPCLVGQRTRFLAAVFILPQEMQEVPRKDLPDQAALRGPGLVEGTHGPGLRRPPPPRPLPILPCALVRDGTAGPARAPLRTPLHSSRGHPVPRRHPLALVGPLTSPSPWRPSQARSASIRVGKWGKGVVGRGERGHGARGRSRGSE